MCKKRDGWSHLFIFVCSLVNMQDFLVIKQHSTLILLHLCVSVLFLLSLNFPFLSSYSSLACLQYGWMFCSSFFFFFFKHWIYKHAVISPRIHAQWLDYCDSKSLRKGNAWTSVHTQTLMFFIIFIHFKAAWKHLFLLQVQNSAFLFRLK